MKWKLNQFRHYSSLQIMNMNMNRTEYHQLIPK